MSTPAPAPRPRVLFVGEAATLAHLARPAALMAALDPQRVDGRLACPEHARRFLGADAGRWEPLAGIDPALFAARLRRGEPLMRQAELEAAVDADLALFERRRPDLVVGDFRLSLSVSARLAGVRYAAICNAYWSPYAADRRLPLPVLGWTRRAPLALAQAGFDLLQGPLLAPHCRPLNAVRAARGLAPLPADLRRVYTDADDTLYADSPALFPLHGAPANHRHLGPVLWSPPVPPPPWWDEPVGDGPPVYVTMGSSGDAAAIETVLDALDALGARTMLATAGAPAPRPRAGLRVADYLPGEAAAARAALVVCNGGSPTSQQALAAGTPVLGICSNMDQMLNMRGLEAAGAGIALRADRLSAAAVRRAAAALLSGGPGRETLARLGAGEARERFVRYVDEVTGAAREDRP
ncbi:glycosyltransferase [Rubrivivax sp. JA1026]|uniref:glycosyltransferase n=1 Tax=Rubrivivax sp. JA1026 TaxID=2710888 RepID=UPI0013E92981|nr:nucleotide disphospho-sugar-binding domain-containing protein [Rubrivivax sp. JA1026]